MKHLYRKNFKSLRKEIGEDIKIWKDLPCSWIDMINIAKMTILKKTIYRSSTIPSKIPTEFFTKLERTVLNFMWKIRTMMVTTSCASEGITIPDTKFYYRAIVIKPWYWHKNRELDQ